MELESLFYAIEQERKLERERIYLQRAAPRTPRTTARLPWFRWPQRLRVAFVRSNRSPGAERPA
jgi:hypothetical protein